MFIGDHYVQYEVYVLVSNTRSVRGPQSYGLVREMNIIMYKP